MSEYKFKINGRDYQVSVGSVSDKNAQVTVNGQGYNVEIESGTPAPVAPAALKAPGGVSSSQNQTGGKTVNSPLPGVIIEICVKEGESVRRGQKLAVLEAMKMENEILSPADGTISKVYVKKGDSVLEGVQIVAID